MDDSQYYPYPDPGAQSWPLTTPPAAGASGQDTIQSPFTPSNPVPPTPGPQDAPSAVAPGSPGPVATTPPDASYQGDQAPVQQSGQPPPAPDAGSNQGYYYLPGFNIDKLKNENYVDAKYSPAMRTFSKGLASGVQVSRNNLGSMVQWAQQHGFPSARPSGDDSIDFGDGAGPIDVVQTNGTIWFGNAGQATPQNVNTSSASSGSASGAGFSGGGLGGYGGGLGIAGPGGGAVSTPDSASFVRNLLLQQLSGLSSGPDPLRQALQAYDTQSQRDQQSNRDALAERAYAGGNLDTGGFNTAVAQNQESAAGQRANFAGNTTYQDAQNRRQQLTQLLSLATSSGLTQQAQDLQRQIAEIDAQLRAGGLGFNYAQLQAQMNRDAVLAGLNG